jgi:hypothetical protein
MQPTTFAQAVAMPRRQTGRSSGSANDGSGADMTSPGESSRNTPKLILKPTKKKTKKWSPLDLDKPAQGRKSSGSSTDTQASSFTPSPTAEPFVPSSILSRDNSSSEGSALPCIDKREDRADSDYDPDPTPTQSSFNRSIGLAPSLEPDCQLQRPILHREDSENTKNKLENIMARIDDAFDVEEWDADLQPNGPDNSPEPLTAKAQPLAYTTVGSLVKSNAIPQFTAPVRIQREGASRRPPPSSIQSRGYDNYQTVRGTSGQFGMAYKPPYPPLRGPKFAPQHQKSHSFVDLSEAEEKILRSLGVSSPPTRGGSSEDEKDTHHQNLGYSTPSIRSGNSPATSHAIGPHADLFTGERTAPSPNLQNILKDQPVHQPISAKSFMSNLRMQSLLNLAQYPNRDQQAAKNHLEFAAAKVQSTGMVSSGLAVQQPGKLSILNCGQKDGDTVSVKAEGDKQRLTVDNEYSFLSPGLNRTSKQEPQPALYGRTQGYPSRASVDQLDLEKQAYLLSGRPFPLTAGPPGPRQNGGRPKLPALTSFGNPQSGTLSQQAAALPPNSPWGPHNPQNMFSSTPREGTEIRDTLSPAEAAKYYPNGFPEDMNGKYTRLNSKEKQKMLGPIGPPGGTEKEKQRKEHEIWKQEQWWYHGIRRLDMTAEDHLCRLEKREYERSIGQNPQPPQSPGPISERPTLTLDEINKMSPSKTAAPLLNGLFGTLLDYADAVVTPTNRKVMSNFSTPPAWQIDHCENGNVSFFGEDCGPQPKRLGRDQRYEPSRE